MNYDNWKEMNLDEWDAYREVKEEKNIDTDTDIITSIILTKHKREPCGCFSCEFCKCDVI